MVDGVAEVDVASHPHTDEPPRTRRIHQGLLLIGGADERGVAAILLDGLAIGRTELHVAGAQQVFQHDLLAVGGLVELVEVDDGKRGQCDIQVELVLEVQLVVVVVAQFRRQDDLAETGLSATLTAYQQRR